MIYVTYKLNDLEYDETEKIFNNIEEAEAFFEGLLSECSRAVILRIIKGEELQFKKVSIYKIQ